MNRKQTLATVLSKLREKFPVDSKIVVRYKKACDPGTTMFDGETYTLIIANQGTLQAQIDSLLHEWAHVVAIEKARKHCAAWGECYAAILSACFTDDGELI